MDEDLGFPGRLEGERLQIREGRHPFTALSWLGLPCLALVAGLLAAWLLTQTVRADLIPLTSLGLALAWLALVAPPGAWSLWTYLNWRNDVYVVTDRRALHIERVHFLFERRDEAYLEEIQDVLVVFPSPAAALLDFGDVQLQTAGATGMIRFQSIARPRAIQRAVMAQVERIRSGDAALAADDEELESIRELLGVAAPTPEGPSAGAPAEEPGRSFPALLRRVFRPAEIYGEDRLVWRKHWWVLARSLVRPTLALGLLLASWISLRSLVGGGDPGVLDVVVAPALGAALGWIVWSVIDWQNDLYLVTSDRVIDIEKIPLVFEHRREASLENIQNVRYVQGSFLAKQLDFGDVLLETASETGGFTFDRVPHPREVEGAIMRRLEGFREHEQDREERWQDDRILGWLSRYHARVGSPPSGRSKGS